MAAILCDDLKSREGLYLKAAEITQGAKVVLDTTWGSGAREPSPRERNAPDLRIQAQFQAMKVGGELFAREVESPSVRIKRMAESGERRGREHLGAKSEETLMPAVDQV